MTVKNIGSSGVEFPDSTVQGSAAYTKAQSDAAFLGQAAADARYVNVAGDTMTGSLVIQAAGASFDLLSPGVIHQTTYLDNSGNYLVVFKGTPLAGVYLTPVPGSNFMSNSDERIKNITGPIENAVEKIGTLRTVMGSFKSDEQHRERSFLIAQDVQAIMPSIVAEREGILGLEYTGMIPLLTAAIKELSAKVAELEARL